MADYFDINNVTSGVATKGPLEALILLKDLLVTAGGTVEASGQGVGGSFGSGDYWTSVAACGVGAWCVINLADGTRQLIMQMYPVGTVEHYWAIYISVDGTYTSTGATATQVGTPTHYKAVYSGTAGLIDTTPRQFFQSNGVQVWQAFARSDGSFWFFAWNNGSSQAYTMLCFDVLAYGVAGDNDPAVYCATYGALNTSTIGLFDDAKGFMNYVASPYAGDWVSPSAMTLSNSTGYVFPSTNRINPHNSKWDVLPVQYGIRDTSVSGSYKGRSSLFGISTRASSSDYFTTFNLSASKDTARIYPLVLLDWPAGTDLEY